MTTQVPLAKFLCDTILKAGCKHVFGIPGDFNLGLLDQVLESDLKYVGCCNELNAAYAADGYARVAGLAACVTTYAVGELSALNGVAGSYAESVPVIKITGAPARKFYHQRPLLHHTLGDYNTPLHIFTRVTVDQCLLNDTKTAAKNIVRVIRHCLLYKQPVYIAVPADMVTELIDVEDEYLTWTPPTEPESSADPLEEAVQEICQRLKEAKKPLLIPGVELIRRGLESKFEELTDKCNIPYVTMLLAKGIIREDHPNFAGLYMGHRSRPEVCKLVSESDCVLILGEKMTDLNTGGFTMDYNDKSRIMVNYNNVQIRSHSYTNVYIGALIEKLLECIPQAASIRYEFPRASHFCVSRRGLGDSLVPTEKLTMKGTFNKLAEFLESGHLVIAETGSSMFSVAETQLPNGCKYFGQTFYGSIGYTVGACFGASIALKHEGKGRRSILIVGDGSFQLTCQEISSMIRHKCNPIIILVNNDGYLIERVITDNSYNDIQMWRYHMLPWIFGCDKESLFKVEDYAGLKDALGYAKANLEKLVFIEAVFDKWDCNKLLKSAGRMMAINNNLTPSITEEMLKDA